jgi:transcription elongation factor Elf1
MIIYACPRCGADLQIICYTTYPAIYDYVCPVCGWSHEERETVERIPFDVDVGGQHEEG